MKPSPKPRSKVQRVNALIELTLDDPVIRRDAEILRKLKQTVRRSIANPRRKGPLTRLPSLYSRYRGTGFPLRTKTGHRLPMWRSLSPWMKVQLATLVLSEGSYLPFKLHLHDDVVKELSASGGDLREYLHRNLYAHLNRRFERVPRFFFVMEDRSKSGELTRPHAHGAIELRPATLPDEPSEMSASARRLVQLHGREVAELRFCQELTRKALKGAAGLLHRPRHALVSGVDQCRNLWTDRPYGRLFNTDWVDYAFKNQKRISPTLGERRLVIPHELTGEARRLWNLIKRGEEALNQWD